MIQIAICDDSNYDTTLLKSILRNEINHISNISFLIIFAIKAMLLS